MRVNLVASFRILFDSIAKAVRHSRLGMQELFLFFTKIALMVLKAYAGFSDRPLVEHFNGSCFASSWHIRPTQ